MSNFNYDDVDPSGGGGAGRRGLERGLRTAGRWRGGGRPAAAIQRACRVVVVMPCLPLPPCCWCAPRGWTDQTNHTHTRARMNTLAVALNLLLLLSLLPQSGAPSGGTSSSVD